MPEDQAKSQSQDQVKQSDSAYDVVVNGESKKVGLADLIAGYQQNDSYTQKSQKLSEREKQIEKAIEDKATELYLKALSDGSANGDKDSNKENLDPESKLKEQLNSLQNRVSQAEQASLDRESDAKLDAVLSSVSKKYPEMDAEKVMIRFYNEAKDYDNIEETFEKFAKESHEKALKHKQSIIDSYVKEKTSNKFSSGESGHSGVNSGKVAEPVKSFAEARERAAARLGI